MSKYYQANDPDCNGRGFYFGKIVQKPGAMLCQRVFHYPRIRYTLLLKLRSHGPLGSSTEVLCSDMYKTKLACIKQLLCVWTIFKITQNTLPIIGRRLSACKF